MDVFAGQAEVFDLRRDVLDRNIPLALPAMTLNLAPLLRGVVLVRKAALAYPHAFPDLDGRRV